MTNVEFPVNLTIMSLDRAQNGHRRAGWFESTVQPKYMFKILLIMVPQSFIILLIITT